MDVSVLSIFSSRMIFIIAHQSQEPDYVFDLLPCLLIYFHVLSMKQVGFDDGIPKGMYNGDIFAVPRKINAEVEERER